MPTLDRYQGCLLGLALGDALGAPYEGGPLERLLWRLIGTTRKGGMRWTDDTQMSLDLAESLLERSGLDADDVAQRFAASYRWSRGYGPGAAKVLQRIDRGMGWQQASRSVYPAGSFGNGGAMRAPVLGLWCAQQPQALVEAARLSAQVTNAHPLGMEGAVLLASATALSLVLDEPLAILQGAAAHCTLEPFTTRLALAAHWLHTENAPSAQDIARQLGNGMAASTSCVTALYMALRFRHLPFQSMLDRVIALGGDVDTIAAMAGAVWGAGRGLADLPVAALARLEQSERLLRVAQALHGARGLAS